MAAWVYSDDPAAQAALSQIEAWMQHVEAELSRFLPQSDLSRLNANDGRPHKASPTLWQVTSLALEMAQATDGQFDPTMGRALNAAGYDRTFEALAPDEAKVSPLTHTPHAWQQIELDEDNHTITLPPGRMLDLGGITKGWAADEALQSLTPFGPALVDAGGDLAVGAAPPEVSGWQIGIFDPLHRDADLAIVELTHCGLATSGTDYRRWRQRGRIQHHILDAATGRPAATDLLTASVIAPSAIEADVQALVLVASGFDRAQIWLQTHPHLSAFLVRNDGTPYHTHAFADHVISYYPLYA